MMIMLLTPFQDDPQRNQVFDKEQLEDLQLLVKGLDFAPADDAKILQEAWRRRQIGEEIYLEDLKENILK
jgi:hypothetical protein